MPPQTPLQALLWPSLPCFAHLVLSSWCFAAIGGPAQAVGAGETAFVPAVEGVPAAVLENEGALGPKTDVRVADGELWLFLRLSFMPNSTCVHKSAHVCRLPTHKA